MGRSGNIERKVGGYTQTEIKKTKVCVRGHKSSHEAEIANAAVVSTVLRSLIQVRQHYHISQDNSILTSD